MSIKSERVAHDILRELADILANEVKDKHIKFVSVTHVGLTQDKSHAKIYFNLLDNSKVDETLKALEHASGFIRTQLGHRLKVRKVPSLVFLYDESLDYGRKMEEIISKIKEG